MDREVKGIVKQTPVMLERGCIFVVEQDKESYLIVSTDTQAIKDNLFVELGQEISIKGSLLKTLDLKGVFITEKAKITLMKIDRKTENE